MSLEELQEKIGWPVGVKARNLCPRGICDRCDAAWDDAVCACILAHYAQLPPARGEQATLTTIADGGRVNGGEL